MANSAVHDELELEDVQLESDGGSELADAYAAAYDEAAAAGDDDDDHEDGSSVAGPSKARAPIYYDGKGQHRGVEVALQAAESSKPKRNGGDGKPRSTANFLTPQDRRNRLAAHLLHVLCLIAWARGRNVLLNDDGLRDFLADMVPAALITKLRSIHPKKIPEQRERVRLFEAFMVELIQWWTSRFHIDPDLAARAAIRQPAAATELLIPANARALPSGKIIDGWVVESPKEREDRHRKEAKAKGKQRSTSDQKGKAPERAAEIAIFPPGQQSAQTTTVPTYLRLLPAPEPIITAADLREAASNRRGSRETSAQLFCALCRAIGVPARLVVSLQVPPYSVGASKLASIATEADKLMRKNPPTSNHGIRLAKRSSAKQPAQATVEPINLASPPTVWVEVFSKSFQRWLTVDPIRGELQATGNRYMEPAPHDKDNKLVYVIAVEEDNYCRDVTARYTRSLRSRVARLRPPAAMTGGQDWWARVMTLIHRPQHLDRDAIEDAEMDQAIQREPMPKSMATFKNHPVYVLEAQLKRNEAIWPRNRVGTFEGHDVFLRQDVVEVHSVRQWYLNYGRILRRGPDGSESTEEPLKWAKTRGYTIANKRAEEQARSEGREAPQEGLYAEFQTETYVAEPVREDGTVPTNEFGNVDLYVPSMLPPGGVYIPFSGAGKVAKQLHIPYADAVTGFEFRRGRSNPKLEGIVVAQFNAQTVLEAFWETERNNAEKARIKVHERAIRNWRRACKAVLISLRIKRQYGPGSSAAADAAFRQAMGRDEGGAGGKKGKKKEEVRQLRKLREDEDQDSDLDPAAGGGGGGGFLLDSADSPAPGGFLLDDDDEDGESNGNARTPTTSSPAPYVDTSFSTNGKKRKIISLYDLDDGDGSVEDGEDDLAQTRHEAMDEDEEEKDEIPASGRRRQQRAKASSKRARVSRKSKTANKATTTPATPLRRSTRASAQQSTSRLRDRDRAQLDALRDVLDDDELAMEERELGEAETDDSDEDD